MPLQRNCRRWAEIKSQLDDLRQEADDYATFEGHDMVWSDLAQVGSRMLQFATCAKCGMGLQINTQPLPNDRLQRNISHAIPSRQARYWLGGNDHPTRGESVQSRANCGRRYRTPPTERGRPL